MNENALKLNISRLFLAKTLFLWILAFSICCLLPHPIAQAANNKKIEKTVNSYMNAVKKYDIGKVKSMQIDKDVFHIIDKRFVKYIKKANKDCFKYEIKKMRVKKTSATVTLRVQYYDCKSDFKDSLKTLLKYYDKTWSSDDVRKYILNDLKSVYDPEYEGAVRTKTITLHLVKIGDSWKITKMGKKLLYAKDCGLTLLMDDFIKNPLKYLW